MAAAKKIKLGQAVTYVSSKGYEKMALVIGTPETIKPNHDVPELEGDSLHLSVFAPNGTRYTRYSVPSKTQAQVNAPEGEELYGGYYTV